MKSNKNCITSSIKRQFLLVDVLAVIIILSGIIVGMAVVKNEESLTDIINSFNELYIQAANYVKHDDQSTESYIKSLAEYGNANLAIVDDDGRIIMKSENVTRESIDMDYIKKIFQKDAQDDNFYQRYTLNIDGAERTLLIWKKYKGEFAAIRMFLIIVISCVGIAAIILYLFINGKVKYIKDMAKGAEEFSNGNFGYRIEKRGRDELATLGNSMNDMAGSIAENIEARERDESAKRELITNVSHDLRTPLTSLIGYLQLMNDEGIAEEDRKKYAGICLKKSYKLKSLIEELFEYSKLESYKSALEIQRANIVEVMEQSIGELYNEAQKKNMKFQKKFSSSIIMMDIDCQKMGRVLENLIGNSIKYGSPGTDICIFLEDEGKYAVIKIENSTDNNEGDITKIFERFYRGDSSRNSKVEGSGLGLSIVKDIIILHGGEISADIDDDIFRITIKMPKEAVKF